MTTLSLMCFAVNKFNKTATEPIRSVLCPGLGTAVGSMAPDRCAYQVLNECKTKRAILGNHL